MSTQAKPQSSFSFNVGHFVGSRLLPLAVIVLLGWYALRVNYGSKGTERIVASVTHTPITLTDETQNVAANSWRGIGINVPYNGKLDVSLRIVRGNPLDVILMDASQLDVLKNGGWGNVSSYTNFSAVKTTSYRRNSPVNQGTYYLVLRDTSLGILSQSASDVAVKVTLNP
jgi:hypothetical protein